MLKNIIYITIAAVFIMAYLRYFEYRSLYFPTKDIEATDYMGLEYEDIYFKTRDGARLNGWFFKAKDPIFTVLLCHGNGGNISHRMEKIALLRGMRLDVFIFDYRGYGRSAGRPSEKGLYIDAESAYNYLVSERKIQAEKIILYGESLGGAVAIDLALRKNAGALIVESAFSSAKDMAKVIYSFFPVFFISDRFDSAAKIGKVNMAKLIIHSRSDEIVPFTQSEKLFNLAAEPKTHLKLTGDHSTCYVDSEDLFVSGINRFLESIIRDDRSSNGDI